MRNDNAQFANKFINMYSKTINITELKEEKYNDLLNKKSIIIQKRYTCGYYRETIQVLDHNYFKNISLSDFTNLTYDGYLFYIIDVNYNNKNGYLGTFRSVYDLHLENNKIIEMNTYSRIKFNNSQKWEFKRNWDDINYKL